MSHQSKEDQIIKEAFGKIKAEYSAKEHVFYEVQRDFDKKGFISKAKLRYFKRRMDRFVPAIALFVIVFCVFSFYSVSTGLFTDGKVYKSSNEIMEEYREKTGETDSGDEADYTAPEAKSAENTDEGALIDISVIAAKDIGFTEFKISQIPDDIFTIWEEMQNIGAAPTFFDLVSCSFDANEDQHTLIVDFDEKLQEFMDNSASLDVLTGIVKSFSNYYTDCDAIVINSGDKPVTFQGKEVDTAEMMASDIKVMAHETVNYGE